MKLLAIVLGVALVLPGCSGMGQRIQTAATTPSAALDGQTPLQVLGISAGQLAIELPALIAAIQQGNIPSAILIAGKPFGPGSPAWTAINIVIQAALQTPAQPPVPKGLREGVGEGPRLRWEYRA